MKRVVLFFCIIIFLTACQKREFKDISVQDIFININNEYILENATIENLKNQDTASKYGIAPSDIKEGIAYYSNNENSIDMLIIIKASNKAKVKNLEQALSYKIISLKESWKDNKKESEKLDNNLFKTKGNYIILCISENCDEIEKIFDDILDINS